VAAPPRPPAAPPPPPPPRPAPAPRATIPGVDPVAQFHAEEAFAASFTDDSADYNVDAEPPLRDYAR
jgi:hypothetical protein